MANEKKIYNNNNNNNINNNNNNNNNDNILVQVVNCTYATTMYSNIIITVHLNNV